MHRHLWGRAARRPNEICSKEALTEDLNETVRRTLMFHPLLKKEYDVSWTHLHPVDGELRFLVRELSLAADNLPKGARAEIRGVAEGMHTAFREYIEAGRHTGVVSGLDPNRSHARRSLQLAIFRLAELTSNGPRHQVPGYVNFEDQ